MKKVATILFFVFSVSVYSQQRYTPKYPQLFKTIPLKQDKDPQWVKLLFSVEPNIYEIKKSYKKYYSDRVFVKNIFTQNYKYFSRQITRLRYDIDINGKISNPRENIFYKSNNRKKDTKSKKVINDFFFSPKWPMNRSGGWEANLNPTKAYQGNVYSLYVFEDKNRMFCYTEGGGVYYSSNAGELWNNITPFEKTSNYFNGSYVTTTADEKNNVLYFSFGGGIYSSNDLGTTWNFLNVRGDGDIVKIEYVNDRLYYLKNSGNFESPGGLYSITNNDSQELIFEGRIWDFQIPDSTQIIYLTKQNLSLDVPEVYKSIDSGKNFTKKSNGLPITDNGKSISSEQIKLGISKSNPNIVYAAFLGDVIDEIEDLGWLGVYKSIDGGQSWNNTNPSGELGGPYTLIENPCLVCAAAAADNNYFQGWYDFDLEVSDSNPDLLWIGGIGLSQSNNGGNSWKRINGGHADTQDIVTVDNKLFIATDGGISRHGLKTKDSFVFSDSTLPITLEVDNFITTASLQISNTDEIEHMEILVNINHPSIYDLTLTLISPAGDRYQLVTGYGTIAGDSFSNTIFSSIIGEVGSWIYQGQPPFTGTYIPDAWATLENVNGKPANGEWTLEIINQTDSNIAGELLNFEINIKTLTDITPGSTQLANTSKIESIINNGIHDTEFVGFGIGTSKLIMVGGTWHNGNKAMNSNYPEGKFQRVFGVEEPTGYVNQGDNNIVGVSTSYDQDSYQKFRISDSLEVRPKSYSWKNSIAPNEAYSNSQKSDLETHPVYFDKVIFGRHNGIYSSDDYGATSELLHSFGGDQDNDGSVNMFNWTEGNLITDVKYSRSNPNVIFAVKRNRYSTPRVEAGTSHLHKSSDGGLTWEQVSLPFSEFNGLLNIDINDKGRLFLSSNSHKKIYYSDNLGSSFDELVNLNNTIAPTDIIAIDGTNNLLIHEQASSNQFTSDKIYLSSPGNIEDITNNMLPSYVDIQEVEIFYGSNKVYFSSNAGIWESNKSIVPDNIFLYPTVQKELYFSDDKIKLSSFTNIEKEKIDYYEWIVDGNSFTSYNYLLVINEEKNPLDITFESNQKSKKIDLQLKIHLKDGTSHSSEILEQVIDIEKKITNQYLDGFNNLKFDESIGILQINDCAPLPLVTDAERNVLIGLDLSSQTLALTNYAFFQNTRTQPEGSDNISFIENFIGDNNAKVLVATVNWSFRYNDYMHIWDTLSSKGMQIDFRETYTKTDSQWLPSDLSVYDVIIIDIRNKVALNEKQKLKSFISDPSKKTIAAGDGRNWSVWQKWADSVQEDPNSYPLNEIISASNMSFPENSIQANLNERIFYPYSLYEDINSTEVSCLDINRDGVLDGNLNDSDGDGIPDIIDNCIDIPNTDQSNIDQDELGDVCDLDDDNDGILDDLDNCPFIVNENQLDTDNDGIGDVCDPDDDNDGILDDLDNCPLTVNENQIDSDNDGIGDTCDQDSDNDGVLDQNDICPETIVLSNTLIDLNGCPIFNLPQDSFNIAVTSASCIGENNGKISISASSDCIIGQTSPGDYTINMQDSYGDGWNGAYISLVIDEVESKIGIPTNVQSDPNGDFIELNSELLFEDKGPTTYSSTSYSFTIPENAVNISFSWVPADYNYEVSFTILSDTSLAYSALEPQTGLIELCKNSIRYLATVNGEEPISLDSVTGYSKTIENLSPGLYQLCFSVEGQSSYNQCYDLKINQPQPLSVYSRVNNSKKSLSLYVEGSSSYFIKLNGQINLVNSSSSNLELKSGVNFLEIYTDQQCQGVYTEEIFVSEEVQYFPNPTKGYFQVYVSGNDDQVNLTINGVNGYCYQEEIISISNSRKIDLDLSPYNNGIYIIQLQGPTVNKSFKIIKR